MDRIFSFIGMEDRKSIRCAGEDRRAHNIQGSSLRRPCRRSGLHQFYVARFFCFN